MGPLKAIASCYANILNFSGRARRAEYWWFALFLAVAATAAQIGLGYVFARDPELLLRVTNASASKAFFNNNTELLYYIGYFYAGYIVLGWLPQLSVTVRRLHDTDRSGWVILMPTAVTILALVGAVFLIPFLGSPESAMPIILMVATVPLIASVWFLVVLCLPGTHGNNRFGPDPAPDRNRPPPAHPAFVRQLPDDVREAVQAKNQSDFAEYYRTRVAPAIQQNKAARSG